VLTSLAMGCTTLRPLPSPIGPGVAEFRKMVKAGDRVSVVTTKDETVELDVTATSETELQGTRPTHWIEGKTPVQVAIPFDSIRQVDLRQTDKKATAWLIAAGIAAAAAIAIVVHYENSQCGNSNVCSDSCPCGAP